MFALPPQTLSNVTMQQAVTLLREQKIPVCFEQLPLDTTRYTRREDGRIEYEQTRFTLKTVPDSTEKLLDAFCQADGGYAWERTGKRPTYTLYPAQGGVLTWNITQTLPRQATWEAIFNQIELAAHHIEVFTRGLMAFPALTLDDFSPPGTTARVWLSALVDYAGSGYYWTLAGLSTRVLSIGRV